MHHGRPYAYLVMQLLPGKPLSAVLEAGPLPLPKALYTASCVADALDAAHEAGLTHRDIKPSNIMVRDSGEATVVDFGITKGSDARHDITTTGVLIGTPAYMAPEALAGTFDHRSDLYSLGCVLYEAVTGRRPFTGTSWHLINQHLKSRPPRYAPCARTLPWSWSNWSPGSWPRTPAIGRTAQMRSTTSSKRSTTATSATPHRPAAEPTSRPRSGSARTKPPAVRSSPCA
ncbi:serine/threonine-protein kinase [Streptomyces sp. AM6-12]|uniref:serine/threonine-protein kinase n=1 Tax=Streptomyces sp. AM6-12 TaxID=3345149 RepID=UPI0037B9B4C5